MLSVEGRGREEEEGGVNIFLTCAGMVTSKCQPPLAGCTPNAAIRSHGTRPGSHMLDRFHFPSPFPQTPSIASKTCHGCLSDANLLCQEIPSRHTAALPHCLPTVLGAPFSYSPQELYCWFERLTTLPASCTPVTRSRPSGIGVHNLGYGKGRTGSTFGSLSHHRRTTRVCSLTDIACSAVQLFCHVVENQNIMRWSSLIPESGEPPLNCRERSC